MGDRSGDQLDNYRLIRPLGRGTYGEVYLAQHVYRQTLVAVKLLEMSLDQDQLYDFVNEARIFRLQHPHIVSVLDFGIESATGTPFIVMQYVPNGTLRQRYARGTQVPLARIVQYVNQVASALAYAHEENLVHRDVKPDNMLLDAKGNVLLSDFGISIASQSMRYSTQPAAMLVGTPNYMAPEQFLGKAGRASDQYALGVVVYEWLSGTWPFQGSLYELFGQHLQVPPPPLPPSIPLYSRKLEAIVMKALAKKPEERFASIWEFANALENHYQQLFAASHAPTLLGRTREQCLEDGDELCKQQRYPEAVAAYTLALQLDPNDALAYNNRGLAYRFLQDYHKALADYNRAIELNPDSASQYNNRGYAYQLQQDYRAAIADYDCALALKPDYTAVYNNRGNTYSLLGEFVQAIVDYDRAIELDPTYTTAYYNRGNAYDELQEPQKALADFNRAIELNPDYANAYNNLAYIYRNLGDYQEALANYDRALDLNPGSVNSYNGRALTYAQLQDYARALADYDRALELNPGDRSTLTNKTNLLRKLQPQE